MITSVIPNVLLRSSRPGYDSTDVSGDDVTAWIAHAKKAGVRTILCLLDKRQLQYYRALGEGGLLGTYRKAGFNVIHRPVADYQQPAVSTKVLQRIAADFLAAELPCWCTARRGLTGQAQSWTI